MTNADLNTKDGRRLLKTVAKSDIDGHGTILFYYPELKGKVGVKHVESSNFATPLNFPKEIVNLLKKGKLSRMGMPLEILNREGYYRLCSLKWWYSFLGLFKATWHWENFFSIGWWIERSPEEKPVWQIYTSVVKEAKNRNKIWK